MGSPQKLTAQRRPQRSPSISFGSHHATAASVSFFFDFLCRSPENVAICKIWNPRWTCKVVPTFFADFMTGVMTTASQNNVIHRLAVLLIPWGTKAVSDGSRPLLQVMTDIEMTSSRSLIRGRLVDPSKIDFWLAQWMDKSMRAISWLGMCSSAPKGRVRIYFPPHRYEAPLRCVGPQRI